MDFTITLTGSPKRFKLTGSLVTKLTSMAIIHLAVLGGLVSSAIKSSILPRFVCARIVIRFLDTAGAAKMSRRRSRNPTKAISITLPMSILDEIDDKLTRTQSRSAWIAAACNLALQDEAISIPTRQLMAMLHARIDEPVLKTLLLDKLTSSNPSEEA